ncbi:MAG: N-acyl homoserine lactonase family protein [Desulfomonilaceae bacterium]
MSMKRRDFLIASAAAMGTMAGGAGISAASEEQGSGTEETKTIPTYEIYALKYVGPMTGKLALVLWMEDWDKEVDRNYYIWAIKRKDEIMVVDTGCSPSLANQRNVKHYENPVDVLARIGANQTNVKKVFVTHMHWDHVGGVEMFSRAFPEAVFYVQTKEFDFWIKNPIAKKAPFLKVSDERSLSAFAALDGSPRLQQLTGDTQIMPGIETLLAPGHTTGLQAVAVNTSKGTAIVASDCAHVHESFVQDIPSCFITDMIAWMESYDKLRAKASSIDLIFPGHDSKMLNDFPKVAENITRLV